MTREWVRWGGVCLAMMLPLATAGCGGSPEPVPPPGTSAGLTGSAAGYSSGYNSASEPVPAQPTMTGQTVTVGGATCQLSVTVQPISPGKAVRVRRAICPTADPRLPPDTLVTVELGRELVAQP